MFWVGNQGEGTSPCCTLFFSDFRTSFSFSLWLGWWDHFTRRTETFQKISNMYGYLFVHITLHGFFSEFSVVRGGGNDGTVSTGCGSPSVLHPWMLLLHMQETALWIPPVCCVLDDICKRQLLWILRGAFCPLEGGPRHIGTDTLAPVLHTSKSPSLSGTYYRCQWIVLQVRRIRQVRGASLLYLYRHYLLSIFKSIFYSTMFAFFFY